MEVSDSIWDMVNYRKATSGFLATSGRNGKCNAACFSSLQFSDRSTMTMLIGDNHTFRNLRENPNAVFVTATGDDMESARGCRVYLEVREIVTEGPVLDKGRQLVEDAAGPEAGGYIKAFVTFEVIAVRPLVDAGGNG